MVVTVLRISYETSTKRRSSTSKLSRYSFLSIFLVSFSLPLFSNTLHPGAGQRTMGWLGDVLWFLYMCFSSRCVANVPLRGRIRSVRLWLMSLVSRTCFCLLVFENTCRAVLAMKSNSYDVQMIEKSKDHAMWLRDEEVDNMYYGYVGQRL